MFGKDKNETFVPDEVYVSKPKPGIHFIKDGESKVTKPFYNLDETKNTPERFTILKTTGNGKFVKGGMLHYVYNGVEIFTDIKNAIFVDTRSNMISIRDYDKVLSEIDPVDPETRQYVFLLYDETDSDYETRWDSVEGRTQAYEYVKMHIGLFDPKQSVVLTDNVAFKDALSVYNFVTYLKNSGLVPEDDGFDIEEYIFTDYEEED